MEKPSRKNPRCQTQEHDLRSLAASRESKEKWYARVRLKLAFAIGRTKLLLQPLVLKGGPELKPDTVIREPGTYRPFDLKYFKLQLGPIMV